MADVAGVVVAGIGQPLCKFLLFSFRRDSTNFKNGKRDSGSVCPMAQIDIAESPLAVMLRTAQRD